MRNVGGGRFISLDGPSAVGKTTACEGLRIALSSSGDLAVSVTSTPSVSALGRLAREGTHRYSGYALSCLVAADRYHHRTTVVDPALADGRLLVCDRYAPSAFVLDRLDGVPVEFVRRLYAALPPPDLAIILLGDPAACAARATARGVAYSRFHSSDLAVHERESMLFDETARMLSGFGYPTQIIRIGGRTRAEIVGEVAAMVTRVVGNP